MADRRRTAVAALVGLTLVTGGCTAGGDDPGDRGVSAPSPAAPGPSTAAPGPTPTAAPSPRPTAAPSPTLPPLPAASPWQAAPGEVSPEVKQAATAVLEALGTVTDGDSPDPAQRLAAAGLEPGLAAQAGVLVPPAVPAVTTVVYPQYGGLTADSASVMAVVEQTWWTGEGVASRTVTADVRLRRAGDGWAVRGLRPVPPPEQAPTVPEPLASDRLRLPLAARGDLAGDVDPRLVDVLAALASRHDIDVTVVRSGHPREVFGTDRLSNHTRGRAVDLWAIDGVPVVTMAPDDPRLLSVLRIAEQAGSTEIGSPVDLDGPRGRTYFTDALHRDHVHIGFERPERGPDAR